MTRAQSLRVALWHLLAVLALVFVCALGGCDAQPAALDIHGSTWTLHLRWWVWFPLVLWWWARLVGGVRR